MVTRQDRIVALIRTGVPALVGTFLAFLVARIPAVATWIAWGDAQLAAWGLAGVSVQVVLSAVAVAAVIAGYYWLSRLIGSRWPAAEKWLLGSSAVPSYAKPPVVLTLTPHVQGSDLHLKTDNGSTVAVVPIASVIPGPPPEHPSGG
jgi:hypothetical protein